MPGKCSTKPKCVPKCGPSYHHDSDHHHGHKYEYHCDVPPSKPCYDKKVCIDACNLPRNVLKVEKTVLNVSLLTDGSTGPSNPDFSATFEIVLCNNSCHTVCNISVIDSLMGLKAKPFDGAGDNNFGGEVRPYFTNVEIIGCDSTLVPLKFDQIVEKCGELLDTCQSYLEPCAVARIMVRIAGRGFLNPVVPNTGTQTDSEKARVVTLMQNTAIIRGNVVVDHCRKVPIYPIYVKSGLIKGYHVTLEGDIPSDQST